MLYYEPHEDTFLLEDVVRTERLESPKVIVEVGCGSGHISRVLREMYPAAFVISTDVNPFAVQHASSALSRANGEAVRTSIVAGIRAQIDVAFFNPPYIPSPPIRRMEWIDRSWAGGEDGMEVIYMFLEETKDAPLRYLLVTHFNRPKDLIREISMEHTVKVVGERKVLGEHLLVLRIEKIRSEA